MKRLIFVVAVAMAAMLSGCATGPMTPPLSVVTIHEAPGKTKADVCRSARDWAARTYKDSKAVVEVYDLDAGTMIGKGSMSTYALLTPVYVAYTLQVECKDGRARSTFDGFLWGTQPGNITAPITGDTALGIPESVRLRIEKLSTDLGASLNARKTDDF
ncbi:MAG: DUF4468 domain-containing protein [Azonexus sp.]|jgi:hypothetical protein|nr:DUF4468 domain-containing protein [Azonexus sp.]